VQGGWTSGLPAGRKLHGSCSTSWITVHTSTKQRRSHRSFIAIQVADFDRPQSAPGELVTLNSRFATSSRRLSIIQGRRPLGCPYQPSLLVWRFTAECCIISPVQRDFCRRTVMLRHWAEHGVCGDEHRSEQAQGGEAQQPYGCQGCRRHVCGPDCYEKVSTPYHKLVELYMSMLVDMRLFTFWLGGRGWVSGGGGGGGNISSCMGHNA
jgi:hypothetical protein